MTAVADLSQIVRVAPACDALGVPRASFYRWRDQGAKESRRRPSPPRALSPQEREEIHEVLNSERFADRAPATVYAELLDEGRYLCSVRTMYRILDEHGELRERRDQLRHPEYTKPELLATGPNEVWSWDITKLLGPEKWTYYYLYVILDVYSRYVVGWLLADRESAALAKRLIAETVEKQGVDPGDLVLHSDRGPSMRSKRVAQLLADLSVTKSHSRPYTPNDNPFSEAHFKTLKYRPEFPKRFGSLEDGRGFCREFFPWYNEEHRHSGIALLTPHAVHYGQGAEISEYRREVLLEAYRRTPERFVRKVPEPPLLPEAVWINPPKEKTGAGICGVGKEGESAKRSLGEPAPGAQELVPPCGRSPREEPRERSELQSLGPLSHAAVNGDEDGGCPREVLRGRLTPEMNCASQSGPAECSVSDVRSSTLPKVPREIGASHDSVGKGVV